MRIEISEKLSQVAARELPLKGRGEGFPTILKVEEPFSNSREIRKVIGSKDFSLNDGKVDFNLVEPAGVDGAVHQNESGVLLLETLHGSQAAMGGSIVHDPEHAARIVVGRPGHDLFNEAVEGSNPTASFAAAKDFSAMNIKSGQVSPRAAAFIFVFDLHDGSGLCGQCRVKTGAGLNAGLLICRDDKLVVMKGLSTPNALVKTQDTPCFESELWGAGKDPAAMLPRADGVGMEPPPHGAIADGRHESRLADFGSQFGDAPAGKWNIMGCRQFTGKSLNLNDQFWGEKPGVARAAVVRRARRAVLRRTAFATC